jgi:hypothetical protein
VSLSQPLYLKTEISDMRFHRLSVLAIFVPISLAALVFTKTYPAPKPTTQDLVLINKTSGFQILGAERIGNELTVVGKNNYPQSITAFVLTVGNGFRITEDFSTADLSDEVGIQPQRTFTRKYPLPFNQATGTVTLEAVVLDDKSGDGDAAVFEDIRATRLGQAVQIKRALKVFEKYSNDRSDLENLKVDMRAALERPELDTFEAIKEFHPLGTINRKSHQALSDFVKEGLAAGQADILRKIDEAKASPYEENSVHKIKGYYAALLKRL